jgi:hypothetical protein
MKYCVLLIGLLAFACNPSTEKKIERKKEIKGIWYHQDHDTTYWEVVISDSVEFVYFPPAGTIYWNYELIDDSLMTQTYPRSGNLFNNLKIKEFSHDSIKILSDSNYEFTMHRLNLNYDVDKLIALDSTVIDDYITGLNNRAYEWETKHRLGGSRHYSKPE